MKTTNPKEWLGNTAKFFLGDRWLINVITNGDTTVVGITWQHLYFSYAFSERFLEEISSLDNDERKYRCKEFIAYLKIWENFIL